MESKDGAGTLLPAGLEEQYFEVRKPHRSRAGFRSDSRGTECQR